MGQRFMRFNINAELYENEDGELAIKLSDNAVFEYVGIRPGRGFVTEVQELFDSGRRPPEWHLIPSRQLFREPGWHLVGRIGFGHEGRPRPKVELAMEPGRMGQLARRYLRRDLPDMPEDAA